MGMSNTTKMLSGIILITVPSIEYGRVISLGHATDGRPFLHQQCASTRSFPRRSCTRRSPGLAFVDLPSIGGCRRPAACACLVRPPRRAMRGNPDAARVLSIGSLAECGQTGRKALGGFAKDHNVTSGISPKLIVLVYAGALILGAGDTGSWSRADPKPRATTPVHTR